jgi:hypothetical protein
MALKLNGTTVINDSRGLENISNLKTVAGQSILGAGDISIPASAPAVGEFEVVVEGVPVYMNGKWFQALTVESMAPEDVDKILADKGAAVIARRDKLLSDSDWTQLPDSPGDSAVWRTYRQALRDITSQTGFPQNVVWPVAQ